MKKVIKYPLIFLVICIIGFVIYSLLFSDNQQKKLNEILKNTENNEAFLDRYFIYGRSLNMEGHIQTDEDIENVSLVLKNFNKEEEEYNLEYQIKDDIVEFKISQEINNGINLDNIEIGNNYILIKITNKNNELKYYSICNDTEYNGNDYYTITRNGKNNKVLIEFGNYKVQDEKKNYMTLKVKNINLPENIYDIVIDPGHGGKDSGALSLDGKYYESDITMDYGKALKNSLEDLGLKVKLTRDGTNEEDLGIYDMYGKNGRAVIPNNVKAKYTLSIHLNSLPYKIKNGGVEVYAPTMSNLDFAKELADNIVEYANTTYSQGETFKEMNGVYVRYFTDEDIKVSISEAHSNGYEPYNIKENTPYYFMIRETGGIATNAYIDGRNDDYEENPYYNSNIGVETYLLELGYIVCDNDLSNLLNNKEAYIKGITVAVKNYLEL